MPEGATGMGSRASVLAPRTGFEAALLSITFGPGSIIAMLIFVPLVLLAAQA